MKPLVSPSFHSLHMEELLDQALGRSNTAEANIAIRSAVKEISAEMDRAEVTVVGKSAAANQFECPYQAAVCAQKFLAKAKQDQPFYTKESIKLLADLRDDAVKRMSAWDLTKAAAAQTPSLIGLAIRNSTYAALASQNHSHAVETLFLTIAGIVSPRATGARTPGEFASASGMVTGNSNAAAKEAWTTVDAWNQVNSRNVFVEDVIFRQLGRPAHAYVAPTKAEVDKYLSITIPAIGDQGDPRSVEQRTQLALAVPERSREKPAAPQNLVLAL